MLSCDTLQAARPWLCTILQYITLQKRTSVTE